MISYSVVGGGFRRRSLDAANIKIRSKGQDSYNSPRRLTTEVPEAWEVFTIGRTFKFMFAVARLESSSNISSEERLKIRVEVRVIITEPRAVPM